MSKKEPAYEVKGTVRFADGFPAHGLKVSAFDRNQRKKNCWGNADGRAGFYIFSTVASNNWQIEKHLAGKKEVPRGLVTTFFR